MKDTQSESMILAIESAVGGGSISLLRGSTEIAGWIGEGGVSRAEDLLPNISRLLHEAVVDKYDITKLAVSTGPGSYTGIRIGIATALGLRNGLNIPCTGVPVTEAMLVGSNREGSVTTAIPMGKNDVSYQEFSLANKSTPKLMTFDKFLEFARSNIWAEIVAEPSLYARLHESNLNDTTLTRTGENLAYYVGLAASEAEASENLEPLFVKAA